MKKLFKTISILFLTVFAVNALGCAELEVKPYTPSDDGYFTFTAVTDEESGDAVGYSVALNSEAESLPERLALPETHEGLPVTAVAENGFKGASFKELLVPSSVVTIGKMAFAQCAELKKVFFYSTTSVGCTEIGAGAFYECSALTDLDFPKTLKKIDSNAFQGCGMTSVEIPRPVTELGNYAFSRCIHLERVEIAVKLEKVGDGVFSSCSEKLVIVVSESNPYFYAKNGELVKKEG